MKAIFARRHSVVQARVEERHGKPRQNSRRRYLHESMVRSVSQKPQPVAAS